MYIILNRGDCSSYNLNVLYSATCINNSDEKENMIVFFASVHKRFFIPELNLQSFTYICIGTSIVNFIIEMIWNIHHTDGVSNVYRRKSCHHHNNLQIHVKSWPTRNTSQKFLLIWGLSLRGRCPYLL